MEATNGIVIESVYNKQVISESLNGYEEITILRKFLLETQQNQRIFAFCLLTLDSVHLAVQSGWLERNDNARSYKYKNECDPSIIKALFLLALCLAQRVQ